jgi:alpha-tubulin suppressor-like RCC1 family protein
VVLAACDSVLGINEFPAVPDDAGTDATMPSPEAGTHADGAVDAGDATMPSSEAGDGAALDGGLDAADVVDADASDGKDASDPVVSIAVGGTETCAVTASGALYCWGPGPVGDGTGEARWEATRITVLNNLKVLDVCAGTLHTCVSQIATPDGGYGVACWGNNEYGQLGLGYLADSGAPVLSPQFLSSWTPSVPSIECGAFHSCVPAVGANVTCWGSNSYGELGHTRGTHGDVAIPGAPVSEANPNPTADVIALGSPGPLSLGNGFSCEVFGSQVSCWGNNSSLQLNSLDAGSFTPSPVPTLTNIATIAAGTEHACALDASGNVTCWGDNSSGQLGPSGPTIAADASAVGVSVSLGAPGPAKYIAAGGNATCAAFAGVFNGGGLVECWGANEHGQLGHDPATDSMQSCPGNGGPCNPNPISYVVTLNTPATAIAMGPTAACVIETDSTVWCWGSASLAVNGTPSPDASTVQFTPVQVKGLPPP